MANHFFKWNHVVINTYVGHTPNGWILKSVDTKTITLSSNERVTSSMSTSTVEFSDPTHSWRFDRFKWEKIETGTWRARIIGGWIVKSVHTLTIHDDEGNDHLEISSSMIFSPDPSWGWELRNTYSREPLVRMGRPNVLSNRDRDDDLSREMDVEIGDDVGEGGYGVPN